MQEVQTNSIELYLLITISLLLSLARFMWPSFHDLSGTPFQKLFSLRKQEVLNSFSSLVSSLKSCSPFTIASHKRYFSPLFCLPTTYSYTHISSCSKDPEICILHIKLRTTVKQPKQNRLAYRQKIPRHCTCCL